MAKKLYHYSVGFLKPKKGYFTQRVWAETSKSARAKLRRGHKGDNIKILRVTKLKK